MSCFSLTFDTGTLLCLEHTMLFDGDLAGGGARELVSDLGQTMAKEPGRVGDVVGPILRIGPSIIVEYHFEIPAGPSLAVDQLSDHIDKSAQVSPGVQASGSSHKLGCDDLGGQWSGLGSVRIDAPGGRLRALARAFG